MGDFFNGWRRKLGVMMLVLACALMLGWARSFSIGGEYCFGTGESRNYQSVGLRRNGVFWERHICASNEMMGYIPGWNRSSVEALDEGPFLGIIVPIEIDWRWRLCGFDIGEWHDPSDPQFRVTFWMIPFLPIVFPLTVISAFLLVARPRSSMTKMTVDSNSEKLA